MSGSTDGAVRIWEREREQCIRTHWLPKSNDLITLAVSVLTEKETDDRRFLAVAAYDDETVKYWHFGNTFLHDAYDFKDDNKRDEVGLATRMAIRSEDGVTLVAIYSRELGGDYCQQAAPTHPLTSLTSLLLLVDLPERKTFDTRTWPIAAGVTAIAVSSRDSAVLAGGADRELRLWRRCDEVRPTQPEWATRVQSPIRSVAFTLDAGKGLSAHSDGTVKVWDLKTTPRLPRHPEPHLAPIKDFAILNANNKTLVVSCAEDGIIKIWDLISGQLLASTKAEHDASIEALALTQDNKTLFSVSKDGTLRRWAIQKILDNGTLNYSGLMSEDINVIPTDSYRELFYLSLFDDDSKALLARYDKTISVYDIKSGDRIFIEEPHQGSPLSAFDVSRDVSRKAYWIVVGSWNNQVSLYSYNREERKCQQCARVFPSGDHSHIRVQCVKVGKQSAASVQLICGLEDGGIVLVDVHRDGETRTNVDVLRDPCGFSVRGVVMYKKAERAIAVDDKGCLSILNLKRNEGHPLNAQESAFRCAAVSCDESYAITGSESGAVAVLGDLECMAYNAKRFPSHDVECPKPLCKFQGDGPINCVKVAGDRYVLAGGGDGAVHIFEVIRQEQRSR